jgi:hypothetical protein
MATIKKSLKKAKDGDLLDRVSKTKLKDVPAKTERFIERGVKKGKKFVSDAVDKAKNATVGDVGNVLYNTSGVKPIVDLAKSVKKDYDKGGLRKSMEGPRSMIKSVTGLKNGGSTKKKMRNGGSLSGLKASNKRVGPVDPKGAFTKVQERTLAGAKGKAKLVKDKQLGATKMTAKAGKKISKK